MNAADRDTWLAAAAEQFGTPSFVYFTEAIAERIAALRHAFDDQLALSFAVKCNPNPALLKWMVGRVDLLDVSSIGEFRLALQAGWAPALVSFTGPGKREFEIREAVLGGVGLLVLESLREAGIADEVARAAGRVQPVLLRIAPDSVPRGFGDQMAGRPSPFGVDLPDARDALEQIVAMPGLRLAGLHIYSGTQCLKPDAIVENYRGFLSIFTDLCEAVDLTPESLVLGSGLGVPYHDGDTPLPLDAVASAILPDIARFREDPRFAGARLKLELGRYLVAEAGYFLVRVISLKQSRGVSIAICDGGMNNHLPASGHFGMVIRRNYKMHRVGGQSAIDSDTGIYDVTGPLCTSIDRLGGGVTLASLSEGDVIAIHNSGAYGLTASPIHFIGHAPPAELMVIDGALHDVSRFFEATTAWPGEPSPEGQGALATA
ncbi:MULTISPECIES: type III PLP-dependent enzyme [Novosphingobium]|jgi:diaminopimelate decarboxylase|uniref:type III PLP-dependent enzyme n=1 Tax=Novosphingobium TaxID=165696 RepID=UPI0022F24C65|nr:type III PLP-dependent enzyme [Novosphingobium resinovorum]GLK42578.1 diaminopimelate decarboxylase [Novosphingobium resinovorum]